MITKEECLQICFQEKNDKGQYHLISTELKNAMDMYAKEYAEQVLKERGGWITAESLKAGNELADDLFKQTDSEINFKSTASPNTSLLDALKEVKKLSPLSTPINYNWQNYYNKIQDIVSKAISSASGGGE